MKKLPLALSALAISTVGVTGVASPTFAAPVKTLDYNIGNLDNMIMKVTRVNPRANTVTIVMNKLPSLSSEGFFQMTAFGTAGDRNSYDREISADYSFAVRGGVGWWSEESNTIQNARYRDFGVQLGVEATIPSNEGDLQDNTSGLIYFVGKTLTENVPGMWAGGKIDYSMCVDSGAYKAAAETAGDGDILECRAEMYENGARYYYRPYLNEERLEVAEDELVALEAAAQARRDYDYEEPLPEVRECMEWDEICKEEQEEVARILAEREAAAKAAEEAAAEEARKVAEEEAAARAAEEAAIEAKVAQRVAEELAKQTAEQGGVAANDVVVKNTETGINISDYRGGVIAYRDGATSYRGEVTTVTNEGSASGNSENTGVTDEYATDAKVWAVDESKVWEDGAGAETVETPELGVEDCGHFWPLVIGWVLAIAGWGIMGVRWFIVL